MQIGYHLKGFGTVKSFKKLEGYGSINYFVINELNEKALLKIYSSQDLDLISEEIRIIEEINKIIDFDLPSSITPLLMNTPHDDSFARISRFTEGDNLRKEIATDVVLKQTAKAAGHQLQALQKISSNFYQGRIHDWNLKDAHLNFHKDQYITDPRKRKIVKHFFNQFKDVYFNQFLSLRQGLIHGDLNEANIIIKNGEFKGFIDFGDMSYAPLISEVAILMTYVMMMFPEECVAKGKLILSNFHSKFKILKEEIEILPLLIATRLCVSVCQSAEKKYNGGDTEYILMSEKPAWKLLELWISLNPLYLINEFKDATGYDSSYQPMNEVLEKRKKVASPSLSLSYTKPIHMHQALFQYMYDAQGNTFLDAYNNIPHVGHCHPHVVEAAAKQMASLNTNTRYLYNSYVEYAELLLSHFPIQLDKVLLVNSGSEASDLATRIARTITGKKGIAIVQWSYHGNTQNGINISSYKFERTGGSGSQENILTLPLPKSFNGTKSTALEYFEEAKQMIEEFEAEKFGLAAFIAEPISGCGGQVPIIEGYLSLLSEYLKAKGILVIIDEVQTGFGRLGEWFWGFEMHGIIPDMVVIGKPMGNGHPMGGVVTTYEITQNFHNGMEFFSSFGGNPVSCEIGKAVLNTIKDEKLQDNAKLVGAYWKEELLKISNDFPRLADVRGNGLFIGVECLDENGKENTALANNIKNELRNRYILASTDGPLDNVLKMKPPICFERKDVDRFCVELRSILNSVY
jgi:ethanolamine-phosphate phospho-lyase